ncbi:hypothetical protein BB559_004995 [Furculomyces boomerangus]|uniref:Mitochondrial thiamine pyrophosphate carrier 1 n=1 Tax=Furculomyces boomerangus TaxID=61424 RepID=A0A2T9YBJ3_9FUNG|nr:hypothetical protein BB559_004995 [Furculomyces boomerangus]
MNSKVEPNSLPSTSSLSQRLFGKLVNGAVAGITGVSIIYPIDIAKTRLQNQRPLPNGSMPYRGVIDCIRKIVVSDGIKGLYRGLIPNLVGITPEKAIKLAVNDSMRGYFASKNGTSPEKISIVHGMISGGVAGFCQVVATNPMEIVKIQLQVATQPGSSVVALQSHANNINAFSVVRNLGIKGLYKGSMATLLRDVPFSVIFFPLSALNTKLIQKFFYGKSTNDKPAFSSIFAGSLLSGIVAAVAVTPADVIKTRLQANWKSSSTNSKETILSCGKDIVQKEGIKGLFRGSVPRAMTTAPLFGIALMVYEIQQRYFPI